MISDSLLKYSDAEIASGILCGCHPVLPQFFRHFVPKLVSKVSSSRIGKLFSKKDGSDSSSGKAVLKVEPSDPRTLRGTYLELSNWDTTTGSSTVIAGGKQAETYCFEKNG